MALQQDPTPLGTRAVERPVQPGQRFECAATGCEERVMFRARVRNKVILCNVYEVDRWDRLETFHPLCYLRSGQPHGPVDRTRSDALPPRRPKS